jgi:seryl-tRNA synthetase
MMDAEKLPGLKWHPNGQSSLSGNLLAMFRRLERLFMEWAARCGAGEHLFPTFLSARDLDRLDYFKSFPHLVTFPVVLDSDPANLAAFSGSKALDSNGQVTLAKTSPVGEVLTPAACYHFYSLFQGSELPGPLYLTTRANCYRRETHYLPLRRQWHFNMREIVCLGTAEEVKAFLQSYREHLEGFFRDARLPIRWEAATDPFFNPRSNPKYLLQKLDPVKHEMVYGPAESPLAIGSINFHRNYFGEAFGIRRAGEDAFSGCVAFGLERWIYALIETFGEDPAAWPLPPEGTP